MVFLSNCSVLKSHISRNYELNAELVKNLCCKQLLDALVEVIENSSLNAVPSDRVELELLFRAALHEFVNKSD